ncbi:MAG: hypothetical protein ACLSWI_05915 [Candidatus Gastranaerophilaceae bacterium]
MKKILLISSFLIFASPVFAVCSITGEACTVGFQSNWESKPLQEKVLPNHLNDIQRTDAFQPGYFKPYHDALINTEQDNTPAQQIPNYNSNCQFGVCLPGESTGAGAPIE